MRKQRRNQPTHPNAPFQPTVLFLLDESAEQEALLWTSLCIHLPTCSAIWGGKRLVNSHIAKVWTSPCWTGKFQKINELNMPTCWDRQTDRQTDRYAFVMICRDIHKYFGDLWGSQQYRWVNWTRLFTGWVQFPCNSSFQRESPGNNATKTAMETGSCYQ